ncbi:MAG: FecR domain-containing protein [Oligoflexia bacterium]|nr:FecR domain-containing protein [Oligoflexia bacterium]
MRYVSGCLPILILVLAPAFLPASPVRAAEPVPAAGEVVSVEGVAFIRPDGRESSGLKPAKAGDPVRAGDVVNTSSNGKLKLLLRDKSIVDLGPSALFKVDGYAANTGTDRQVDVSMMYGTMRTAVTQKLTGKGRFKVRTPTATMGVRGTEFVVRSEVRNLSELRGLAAAAAPTALAGAPAAPQAKTEITVIQGQVDVAKQASPDAARGPASAKAEPPKVVSLTAGMQLSAKQGDAPLEKPVTLDSRQLASVASVAKVNDNTFQKAVLIDVTPDKNQPAAASPLAGAGEATRAVLASTPVAAPTFSMPNVLEFIPGAVPPPAQPTFNTTAGMHKLRVIVVTE